MGYFGYLQTYNTGLTIAAKLFATFKKSHPHFDDKVRVWDFSAIHQWLQENVYQYGRELSIDDWLEKATGDKFNVEHLVAYIKEK